MRERNLTVLVELSAMLEEEKGESICQPRQFDGRVKDPTLRHMSCVFYNIPERNVKTLEHVKIFQLASQEKDNRLRLRRQLGQRERETEKAKFPIGPSERVDHISRGGVSRETAISFIFLLFHT